MPSAWRAQSETNSAVWSVFRLVLTRLILFGSFDRRRDISFLLDAAASSGGAFPGCDFACEFSYQTKQACLLQGPDPSGSRRHIASKLNRAICRLVKIRLCRGIPYSQERLRTSADQLMIGSPRSLVRAELLSKLVL
jgi:hypothetical protein